MPQIQPDELTGVAKTLLIPLHFRVEESRSGASIFKDEIGERFHDAIAFNWGEFAADPGQGPMAAGMAAVMSRRFAIFDEQVHTFLDRAPGGCVVNLGAGLDTRFHRLDNGRVEWIELDLPSVIAFRQKLHEPADARHRMIAASVLEDAWVAGIRRRVPGQMLLIAEGLFMYFTEAENRRIFSYLADRFPGQELIFHTIAPSLFQKLFQVRETLVPRLSIKVEMQMQWGLDDSRQVSELHPSVEFLAEYPLMDGPYDQLPGPVREQLTPAMARQVMKIVHVRFRG